MKSLIFAILFLITTMTVAGFLVAQTSSPAKTETAAKQETTSTQPPMDMQSMHSMNNPQSMHPMHRMHTLSGDDAYKQNCTRCHSEVPPVSTRRTKTIVRHMRVRANITAEEAQAILQYLTQ
jgi:hypothetical protein